jgi:hypothetical protein
VKITSSETDIVGSWIVIEGTLRGDAACERIAWLTAHHLRKVAISPQSGAWETLFQDPEDGRFWERTYPQGQMHGGGPPRLTQLRVEKAREKYGIVGQ